MVPQLARGIASGDVPDLMGLDLIYGPQFTAAGQLEDITDLIGDDPLVAQHHRGPPRRGDVRGSALRRAAVRRRLAAVLEQGPVRAGRARPRGAADQPAGDPRHGGGDQRPRQRRLRLLPGGQLRRVQHLHLRPVDLGVGRHDRARRVWRRGARRRQHPDRARVGADDAPGGADRPRRPGGDRCDVRRGVRLGQRRDHGHRQLQRRPGQGSRTPTSSSASPCSPGWSPARRPPSPAATS